MTEPFATSVKAALRCDDKWVLLRNERGEWELPGGRVEAGDASLVAVLERECHEELGVDVTIGELVDAWVFEVLPGRRVIIICYEATAPDATRPVISEEHQAVGLFASEQLDRIPLPEGYLAAIRRVEESERSVKGGDRRRS